MKRIFALLLSLTLVLSLVACGNGNNDNNSSAQSEDKTSSETSSETSSATSSETSSSTSSLTSSKPTTSSKPSTSTQIVIPADVEKPQFAVSEENVYTHQLVRRDLNKENKIYYATPKAKGKYQTVIIMHGQGTVDKFKNRLLTHINTWAKMGYIKPMVVVIPEIFTSYGPSSSTTDSDIDDFQFYIYKSKPNRFNALLTSIETGELSPQIDTKIQPYVSGFSMGGMAALHAGVEYNDRIKHVGALSPAKAFYLGDGKWGIYNYAKDIQFSKEKGACVYLSAGQAEVDFEGKPGFIESINRYEQGIKVKNASILTKFIAPSSWGGHSFEMAQKEIFMYLYLISNGKLPSNKLVEAICCNANEYKVPTIVFKEEEHV